MHLGIASSSVTDFSISGRLVTPIWRNEAEASSLALRLAGSRGEASAWGLLLSLLALLHVGYLVDMMITFQTIREVRLSLTHRRHVNTEINEIKKLRVKILL